MKKILLVFGTRPEAIKMCPLVKAFKANQKFETIVVVSGQHRQMLDQILDCFQIQPDYDLDIMKAGQTLFDITFRVSEGMKTILTKEKPDLVLVHGDTTTAFAAALAAFYLNIPVGHVEAGLRTYNIQSPYPEEFNRQAIDSMSAMYFAPTEDALMHLQREQKQAKDLFLTGNTVIDALNTTVQEDYTHPLLEWAADSRLVLLTAHRRENLANLPRMFRGIRKVLETHPDVKLIYPVHKNPIVQKAAQEVLGDCPSVKLCEPLDMLEFHNIMARSYLILTDSGGIQEEAPSLGKPVLVLRDTTERPEGVAAGTLCLIGTEEDKIIEGFSKLLDQKEVYQKMQNAVNPYGDGHASERIVQAVSERFQS